MPTVTDQCVRKYKMSSIFSTSSLTAVNQSSINENGNGLTTVMTDRAHSEIISVGSMYLTNILVVCRHKTQVSVNSIALFLQNKTGMCEYSCRYLYTENVM